MAKNTFVEKEPADYVYMKNTSGAEVVAGEFCIIGAYGAIAQETIAANAYGNFLIGDGSVVQTDTLTTAEDTFGTANAYVYFNNTSKDFSDQATTGYYKVGQVNEIKTGGVIRFTKFEKAEVVSSSIGDLETIVTANAALGGRFFKKTATLTSAAAATPVHLLTDAEVGAGKKAYVAQVFFSVDGGVNWATTATVALQDTAGTPVVGCTAAVAGLVANAMITLTNTNVTLAAPIADGVGFTTAKGLDIAGNANGTGSNLLVTVFGCIM
jgi:hypothetical protein